MIRLIVTGGGTGGHTYPALTVAVELIKQCQANCESCAVLYVGSADGLEARLAPESNIPFSSISTGKLNRQQKWWRYLTLQTFRNLLNVPVGIVQSHKIIRNFKPTVILSTGGYVSLPCALAGVVNRIPLILHEQTMHLGLANRVIAAFSSCIAVGHSEAIETIGNRARRRAVLTGNPVRDEILQGDPEATTSLFGFSHEDNHLPTIYFTGGIQGSRLINAALLDILPKLLQSARIIHQAGRSSESDGTLAKFRSIRNSLPSDLKKRYCVSAVFDQSIGGIYSLTDLIVGRSGAGTVADAEARTIPAIFVPLKPTNGDEQTKNALKFVKQGGGIIIDQDSLNGDSLLSTIMPLITNTNLLQTMKLSVKKLENNATSRIVDLVRKHGQR